jgi:predicted HAD superfamily hydrolase
MLSKSIGYIKREFSVLNKSNVIPPLQNNDDQNDILLSGMVNFFPLIKPLLDEIPAKVVCEIGLYLGATTKALLAYCQEKDAYYHGVDVFIDKKVREIVSKYNKVEMFETTSFNYLANSTVHDIYFLDTDHNYYTVSNELLLLGKLVSENNAPLVFIHDVGWPFGRRDGYGDTKVIPENYLNPHEYGKGVTLGEKKLVHGGFLGEFPFSINEGGERNGVLTAVEDFLKENPGKWDYIYLPSIFGMFILYPNNRFSLEADKKFAELKKNIDYSFDFLATLEYNRLDLYLTLKNKKNYNILEKKNKNNFGLKFKQLSGKNSALSLKSGVDDRFKTPGLFLRDNVLSEVLNEIKNNPGKYKFVSIDFFDTLVYRFCYNPCNLFIEVFRRLKEMNNLRIDIQPEEFLILRQKAEKQARNEKLRLYKIDEVSIYEIYAYLENIIINPLLGVNLELQAEKELCFINPVIEEFIAELNKMGIKVVLASDTYLSEKELLDILEYNKFDTSAIFKIYTSYDFHFSKATSLIFTVIIKNLNVEPGEIIHIGDNILSDYESPIRKGLKAFLYNPENNYSKDCLDKEAVISGKPYIFNGFQSLRKLSYCLSTQYENEDRRYYQYGAFLLGPIFSRFADWVTKEARKENVDIILPLMREGELLSAVIKNSLIAGNIAIDVEPAYVSRHSTHLAMIGEATKERLIKFIKKINFPTMEKILKELYINPKETKLPFFKYSNIVGTLEDLEFILEIIEPYKEHIENKSAEKRKLFLNYFLNLVKDAKTVIFADLGYSGNTQENIIEILKLENIEIDIIGLYLFTSEKAADKILKGYDIRAFLSHLGKDSFQGCSFSRYPGIIEELIRSNTGTTVGYEEGPEGKVIPTLKDEPVFKKEDEFRNKIKEGIFAFQKIWLNNFQRKFANINKDLAEKIFADMDGYSLAILNRLMSFPIKEEVIDFSVFSHDEDNNTNILSHVLDNRYIKRLNEAGYSGLLKSQPLWFNGVISYSYPEVPNSYFQTWNLLTQNITVENRSVFDYFL